MSREEELDKCKEELYQYWLDRSLYDFKVLRIEECMKIKEQDSTFHTKYERIEYDTQGNVLNDIGDYPDIHCYSGNMEHLILKHIAKKRNVKHNHDDNLFFILEHISPILMKYNVKTFKYGTDMVDLEFLYKGLPLDRLILKDWVNK